MVNKPVYMPDLLQDSTGDSWRGMHSVFMFTALRDVSPSHC